MTEHVKRGFHCDATWHLRKSGALALAIYTKLGALTYDSITGRHGKYFSSGRKLAEFYGTSENHVTKLLRELKATGWLEIVGVTPGIYKSKNYRYVLHDEWAGAHPGQCYVREVMAWDDEEHDELAQALHKHSGGLAYFYKDMLTGLRSTGATNGEIVTAWVHRVMTQPRRASGKKEWKKIALTFVHDFKAGKFRSELMGAK